MPYGPPPPAGGTEGMAVWALILGIVPLFAGLLGIGLGAGALHRVKRNGRKGRGLAVAGIVLGSLWLLGLLALTARAVVWGPRVHRDASGAPTSGGPVRLADLRAGDCTEGLPTGSRITTVDVVPCVKGHVGEVFLAYDFEPGTFPGTTEVTRLARGRCQAALPEYVGAAAGTTGYNIVYVKPTARSWALGQRHVLCLLTTPAHATLYGSMRGTGSVGGGG
jgi:hypothetical protein